MADSYAGYHNDPEDYRCVVFRIGKFWYWQSTGIQLTFGPFATSDHAYKSAMGAHTGKENDQA